MPPELQERVHVALQLLSFEEVEGGYIELNKILDVDFDNVRFKYQYDYNDETILEAVPA